MELRVRAQTHAHTHVNLLRAADRLICHSSAWLTCVRGAAHACRGNRTEQQASSFWHHSTGTPVALPHACYWLLASPASCCRLASIAQHSRHSTAQEAQASPPRRQQPPHSPPSLAHAFHCRPPRRCTSCWPLCACLTSPRCRACSSWVRQ